MVYSCSRRFKVTINNYFRFVFIFVDLITRDAWWVLYCPRMLLGFKFHDSSINYRSYFTTSTRLNSDCFCGIYWRRPLTITHWTSVVSLVPVEVIIVLVDCNSRRAKWSCCCTKMQLGQFILGLALKHCGWLADAIIPSVVEAVMM